jgi:hypothetical protein
MGSKNTFPSHLDTGSGPLADSQAGMGKERVWKLLHTTGPQHAPERHLLPAQGPEPPDPNGETIEERSVQGWWLCGPQLSTEQK